MPSIHQQLAAGRWFELSLFEQFANVGSEVHRALAGQKRGDTVSQERAFERAVDLLDLTIADPRWQRRLKEITRLREILCDYFAGENLYGSTPESWERYFDFFLYAVRGDR